jgi:hypothetical protein
MNICCPVFSRSLRQIHIIALLKKLLIECIYGIYRVRAVFSRLTESARNNVLILQAWRKPRLVRLFVSVWPNRQLRLCSCGVDDSAGSDILCQGVRDDLQPVDAGWSTYYAEGLKAIDWAHNMTESGQDPIFAMIDWKAGVGIAGHSMGGQGTTVAASAECTSKWNIKAAALHHPADSTTNKQGHIGVNISVPTIGFTSSGDSIWPDTEDIMLTDPVLPAAYRFEVGWSHEEPNLGPDRTENPLLATYTAAWFKVFLSGDNSTYYDLIYSNSTDSLCNHAEMVECWVKK